MSCNLKKEEVASLELLKGKQNIGLFAFDFRSPTDATKQTEELYMIIPESSIKRMIML